MTTAARQARRRPLGPTRRAADEARSSRIETETLHYRIHRLSSALAWVLDDHAARHAEIEPELAEALAGVAWEIRELAGASDAVTVTPHTAPKGGE